MTAPLLLGLAALLQLRPQPTPGTVRSGDEYGEPRDAELSSLANEEGGYQRTHVRTRGRLGMVGGFYSLTEGSAQLLVLPGDGFSASDLTALLGARIEARGIVRALRPKEYVGGRDLDLIEDPDLPPLPAPHVSLPRVSLTLLGLSDMEPRARPGARPGRSALAEILADPARYAGKPIRIVGQFRGRNLFGDLPEGSQRAPADWVLKDGEHAVWVVGRAPKGKGFALDPSYKGDSSRWLEVEGKPEVLNGILYLRAGKVALAQRRREDER